MLAVAEVLLTMLMLEMVESAVAVAVEMPHKAVLLELAAVLLAIVAEMEQAHFPVTKAEQVEQTQVAAVEQQIVLQIPVVQEVQE